jgi:hypothetical protein
MGKNDRLDIAILETSCCEGAQKSRAITSRPRIEKGISGFSFYKDGRAPAEEASFRAAWKSCQKHIVNSFA